MKKTFKEFLAEKSSKINSKSFEEKFKNVDCMSKDLTEEEKEYCASKKLLDFIVKSHAAQ